MGKEGLIVVLMVLTLCAPSVICSQDKGPASVIEVTGHALLTVPPNQASITFAVENSEPGVETAIMKNSEFSSSLMTALKKISDKKTVISTSNFTLQPQYEREKDSFGKTGRLLPKSFKVSNVVLVRTSRLDRLGAYIDTAVSAGATKIGGLAFSRDDMDQLQKQAASKALEDAVDSAVKLAKTAGLRINGIQNIQYIPTRVEAGRGNALLAEAAVTPVVIAGDISIESFVNVTFELAR